MEKLYDFEQVCGYLQIDDHKIVNMKQVEYICLRIRDKFDVVCKDEKGDIYINRGVLDLSSVDGGDGESHPLCMWLETWEHSGEYELLGFRFNPYKK